MYLNDLIKKMGCKRGGFYFSSCRGMKFHTTIFRQVGMSPSIAIEVKKVSSPRATNNSSTEGKVQ